ncbi:MAG: hypothetical protein SFX72_11750 [Isosphaeraceae bacterium]|nr:hypothetical protein [Isosphaeraceae bacterium]
MSRNRRSLPAWLAFVHVGAILFALSPHDHRAHEAESAREVCCEDPSPHFDRTIATDSSVSPIDCPICAFRGLDFAVAASAGVEPDFARHLLPVVRSTIPRPTSLLSTRSRAPPEAV